MKWSWVSLGLLAFTVLIGQGISGVGICWGDEGRGKSLDVWPALAPLETESGTGTELPHPPNENPPITRVSNIRKPTIDVFLAEKPNGAAVLVLPGGGFGKVVPDMEGSEVAPRLNKLGISVFVLRYRTNEKKAADEPPWKRPLQDAQRSMRLLKAQAAQWKLQPEKIGLFGFSAGGQVASILLTTETAAYDSIDAVDQQSFRPEFAILVYPWNIYDPKTDGLMAPIVVTAKTPPSFLVHTGDDRSTSLGALKFYEGLKKNNVSAELHIYENGGHGYGTRQVKNSNIGTWADRANDWLVRRGTGNAE